MQAVNRTFASGILRSFQGVSLCLKKDRGADFTLKKDTRSKLLLSLR
jgi:hypothetical protein